MMILLHKTRESKYSFKFCIIKIKFSFKLLDFLSNIVSLNFTMHYYYDYDYHYHYYYCWNKTILNYFIFNFQEEYYINLELFKTFFI
jgi:hypothetical protein